MGEESTKVHYQYFPQIDVLRFIALLMIIFNHTGFLATEGHGFFFTLSGFLITHIAKNEIVKTGNFSFLKYMIRRYLRTLPLFFFIVISTFSCAYLIEINLDEEIKTGEFWPFLFLVNNYTSNDIIFSLGNLWAMGVTEQFYLIWGIFFLLFKEISNKLLGFCILISWLYVTCFWYFSEMNYPYTHTLTYLSSFGIGSYFALLPFSYLNIFNKIKNASLYFSVFFHVLALLIISACFIWSLDGSLLFLLSKDSLLALSYSYIIFYQAYGKYNFFNLKKFPLLGYLGTISFGLYCYHAVVIVVLNQVLKKHGIHFPSYILMSIVLFSTCFIAHFSYQYFEKPILKYKKLF